METAEPLFFWRDSTQEAIRRLVEAKRVTLVVGAGASAEVGYPTWSELVERLLLRALDPTVEVLKADYSEPVREAAARAIAEGGVLGAATMARAALGDRFNQELRACLYGWPDEWRWAAPGATAQAVANLFATMTERDDEACEVLTTNYDLNLEKAMEDVLETEVTGLVGGHEPPPGQFVVRHLHGILTEDGVEKSVALTEADYHTADPTGVPWQESYLRHSRLPVAAGAAAARGRPPQDIGRFQILRRATRSLVRRALQRTPRSQVEGKLPHLAGGDAGDTRRMGR
jgi:hypothetical protein